MPEASYPDSERKRARFDYAAIGMSVLCVLHCAALPILAAALPWVAALGIVDDWFHRLMLLLVIPVSAFALGRAWQKNGEALPPLLGLLGLSLMLLGIMEFFAWHTRVVELVLTLAGAAILSSAHLLNLRNFFRDGQVVSLEMSRS